MSYGDEIMALGQAETLWRATGKRCAIVGADGEKPRRCDLWNNHPAIVQRLPGDGEALNVFRNGPGARPYLTYPFTREGGARFSGWRARDHRGHLHLGALYDWAYEVEEKQLGKRPFIAIEPNLAPEANPNKQWGRHKWATLARDLAGFYPEWEIVQLGAAGTDMLPDARHIETPSFRHACALLAFAKCAVLPEGGLHHAAAAVGTRAVVIFGNHTPVEITGYPEHVNLTGDCALPREDNFGACGRWTRCDHCAASMASIYVDDVSNAVLRLVEEA